MQPPPTENAAAHQAHMDRIELDKHARQGKKAVMQGSKSHRLLNSGSMVASMIAGPLFAAGLLEVARIGLASGLAAAVGSSAMAILGVGAAIAAVAVTVNYFAQAKGQASWFDNAEFTSKENARYIVKEMETHNLCITNKPENPDQCRADGKTWVQYDAARKAEQAQGTAPTSQLMH